MSTTYIVYYPITRFCIIKLGESVSREFFHIEKGQLKKNWIVVKLKKSHELNDIFIELKMHMR